MRFTSESRAKALPAVSLPELIHTACGIHNLLLTGIEGVAGRTDFDVKRLTQGRTGSELVAAAAAHFDLIVFRMGVRFHDGLKKIIRPPRPGRGKAGMIGQLMPLRKGLLPKSRR